MMYELGLYYKRTNIWYYENGFSRSKKVPQGQYEPFLWFSKSDKKWTYTKAANGSVTYSGLYTFDASKQRKARNFPS